MSGSRRFVFQPETRSKPSSSFASRRGISAGSSWRSPSIVTTMSPCASSKPAWSAAALPKLRRSRTTRTSSCAACRRVSAQNVPSVEPSSTKTTSHGSPSCLERRGQLVVQERRRCAPRRARGRSPRSRPLAYVPDAAVALHRRSPCACARAGPAARARSPFRSPLRRAACSRRTSRRGSTCRRFASSAMDGFAVRAADVPGELPIVFRIAAGLPADRPLEAGRGDGDLDRRRGAGGSGRVVPIENVVESDNSRGAGSGRRRERTCGRSEATSAPATPCSRPARCSAPRRSARSPQRASPRSRAAAGPESSCSAPAPSCARRATRSVPGRSTSRTARCSRPRSRLPARSSTGSDRSPTTRRRTARALEWGLEADVLVTSGGVSVGPHDLVRRILGELGVEEDFWRVAVRPGKPLAFATRGATLVFGLPGNPVSSLVAVELFVRPALLALQGGPSPGPSYATARLASPFGATRRGTSSSARAPRVTATRRCSSPLTGQESHMIARAAAADALVLCRPARASSPPASASATCGWASPGLPTRRLLVSLSYETTECRSDVRGRRRGRWSRGRTGQRRVRRVARRSRARRARAARRSRGRIRSRRARVGTRAPRARDQSGWRTRRQDERSGEAERQESEAHDRVSSPGRGSQSQA